MDPRNCACKGHRKPELDFGVPPLCSAAGLAVCRLEVTGKWRYLGDMILSHGQTYIGDLVAMGAAGIGPGRALAHRVNPVDGDQWVLVVDWVRA